MKAELEGSIARLRPLRKADMHKRAKWTGDDELISLMAADPTEEPFVSPDDEEERNADWLQDRLDAGDQLYAIEVDGRYVGDIDLAFFPDARKAEMTVFIGERSAWGRGYGTESVRLVVDELRTEAGVDRVEVDAPKGNNRSLAFWEKLGFQKYTTDGEGRRWLRLSCQGNTVA